MTEILLSPLSNSTLRDWPHYGALIDLIVKKTDFDVVALGSAAQRVAIDRLVRTQPTSRVVNTAGLLSWSDVTARIRAAGLVVANNSGIAHLAARVGAPTVCIFAASHSPYEWMALGARTTVVVKQTVCSPCDLSVATRCPHGVRCLSELDAGMIFDICLARLDDRVASAAKPAAHGA